MKLSLFALSCWFLTPAAFAILDTNNNGLSDFWERDFNNGSLFDESFDPQGDADADGWTNAQEAETGTNPFDANPPDCMIRPIAAHVPAVWSEPDEYNEIYLISPEAVTVTWPTLAGKQYTLYFSPDLTQGSWLPVGDPFVAYGGEATYGFEISQSDKCFWRVTATDVDSDYDGLSNYEEISAGTNPYGADSDDDTISDWQEFTSGTNPLSQDTDGDGIPDPIDSEPLVSSFGFADADGDGIPDADDAAPNDPRGPAPFIASENASGNPLSNLTMDEAVKFVFTVSNPAGPSPTATNLAFFLNGTEEKATITAIGSPVGSSQRFLLTWVAKATANYPTLTIQNLTLRFRDSAQATSWLNLARIDVAEWEGKIITHPFVSSEDSWGYDVMTHLNGMKVNQHFVARNSGANMLYRGPKTMKVINSNGGTSDLQLPDLAIPCLKISGSPGSPPTVVEQQDYATLATGMDVDFVFNNGSAKSLKFELGDAGVNATLSPGQANFDSVSLVNAAFPFGTSALISYLDGADWRLFYSTYWPVANTAGANSRILRSVNVLTTATGQLKLHGVTNYMDRDAKITPYAPGNLEYPGLPQESVTSEYDQKYVAIGSEEWCKIVIKIYPPQQHFTYSKGYRLNLGTGTTGNAAPQAGWMAQTQSAGTFTPLTIPTDGKIEILATDTNLYPQLTSPEGLVLFLKRDANVDQAHVLSLDVLPIVETNTPVKIGALNILPCDVAVDANRDGTITFDTLDETTFEKLFCFWINNDRDKGDTVDEDDWEEDDVFVTHDEPSLPGENINLIDTDNPGLEYSRDLEDFTRVWINFSGTSELFPASDSTVELKVRINSTSIDRTEIVLYQPVETDGGRQYLKNKDTGWNQMQGDYGQELCRVGSNANLVPRRAWENLPADKVVHILFEGLSKGDGEIVFELWKNGSKVFEMPSVHLCLRDVNDMYETYSVGDVTSAGVDFNIWPASVVEKTSGQYLPSPVEPEEKDYVLFVHGWNMPPWEKTAFANTMFKRMWHQGYKGRFGAYRWPTFYGFPDLDATLSHFDASEQRAWNSAAPLGALITSLAGTFKNSSGESLVRLYAHSMGNIVCGEALKQFGSVGAPVHTYIAAQAAISSHVYDRTTAPRKPAYSMEMPNVYGYYWQQGASEWPPQWEIDERPSYMDPQYLPGNVTYINHYNFDDYALNGARWPLNQDLKPDLDYHYTYQGYAGGYSDYRFIRGPRYDQIILQFPANRYDIFSYAADSVADALGKVGATGGKFTRTLNVVPLLVYDSNNGAHKYHSGQFRSTIQKRWNYWNLAMDHMDITIPAQ